MTGSIAAYKGIEVVRGLQKAGNEVRTVMTPAACQLVNPATLAALTKYPVLTTLWDSQQPIPHIELADWTELAVVVPASADIIAKMAQGLADDAASTTLLATAAPKVVVPAMNSHMLQNPATQRNITQLLADGVQVINPVDGILAEGYTGKGRLPEPAAIVAEVQEILHPDQSLAGKRIVITAGGTREAIDPVRFIGNRSSGKMGMALAKAALASGAEVSLIVGQISVPIPQSPRLTLVKVESTGEMLTAVQEQFPKADALIMAAAVADYRPVQTAAQKVKKTAGHDEWQLKLVETPDVLKTVAKGKRPGQFVIGFAAETQHLLKNAQRKLQSKGADMIIANKVGGPASAFGNDNDQVTILTANAVPDEWPQMDKQQVAQRLMKLLAQKLELGD